MCIRDREKFFANVEASKKYITGGDIIQVVGSQRFSAPVTASPLDIYRAVRSINPSPYLFLLELDGFALVGASPELHVRCEEGKVEIRPIAGTRPRGKNEDEDAEMCIRDRFRDWCKEHEEDFESEEARECYKEATGESFWDDLDDDEREGWEHNMTKDSE